MDHCDIPGEIVCSPRTRGWILQDEPLACPAHLLPAHAGMIPRSG
ncbi:hypothetical protein [Nocardiopsis alba]